MFNLLVLQFVQDPMLKHFFITLEKLSKLDKCTVQIFPLIQKKINFSGFLLLSILLPLLLTLVLLILLLLLLYLSNRKQCKTD